MTRQSPLIRAGSGDSHDARIAVLEKRFSEGMRARCSWCNQIQGATQGQWIEILLSTPGTGIATTHVFRCLGCKDAVAVGAGIVAVPRHSERENAKEGLQGPPPLPAVEEVRARAIEATSGKPKTAKATAKSSQKSARPSAKAPKKVPEKAKSAAPARPRRTVGPAASGAGALAVP